MEYFKYMDALITIHVIKQNFRARFYCDVTLFRQEGSMVCHPLGEHYGVVLLAETQDVVLFVWWYWSVPTGMANCPLGMV